MSTRLPIIRRDADGTVTDGTAALLIDRQDGPGAPIHGRVTDFRDLDGVPLALPPGAMFELNIDLSLLNERGRKDVL